jgi:flagellar motor protein MotB
MKKRHFRPVYSFLALGSLLGITAGAQVTEEPRLGEAVERHFTGDDPFRPWTQDPERFATELGDRLEMREVLVEGVETVKLSNVIPPIRFESGVADIPRRYVEELRKVLEGLRDRQNVRLHLVGHADDQPLSGELERRYRDNAGLSRERAGEVAEFLQTALRLAPESIAYEWSGDERPIATNLTAAGRALNRRVEVEVWYDADQSRMARREVLVAEEFKRVKVCRNQTVCKLRFQEGHERRARVKNLVPPLHSEDESAGVHPDFVGQVQQALHNLRDKEGLTVKFIGYTDDGFLTDRNERIYGTQLALSKARAHRVALAVQEALNLSSTAVASDGRGATMPIASNETPQGRATNRRIEVEFWYDDPLQELPDEPQMCPQESGPEVVTRVYDPPWGSIPALQLENGRAIIPPGYADALRRALTDVRDRANARLRFIGYTRNEALDRRTTGVYGDDIGLSAARARRAMQTIKADMALADSQAEHEGRGFLHSPDVVNLGFIQGDTSHVVVQVVYDEPAIRDDYEGVDVTRMARELRPTTSAEARPTSSGAPMSHSSGPTSSSSSTTSGSSHG